NPDAVLEVQLKLAQTNDARRVTVAAPIVSAPVMLAEWKLEPDAGQRLIYQSGTLTPVGGVPDVSGFATWVKIFSSQEAGHAWTLIASAFVLLGAALVVWRWATRGDVSKYSARHLGGAVIGAVALVLAGILVTNLAALAATECNPLPRDVTFLAPVQQTGSALKVDVSNVADETSLLGVIGYGWPVVLALVAWAIAWLTEESPLKNLALVCGWLFAAWAALRFPNGAMPFVWVMAAFVLLHVIIPMLRQLWRVPVKSQLDELPPKHGAAPAAAVIVIGLLALHGAARGGTVGFQPVAKTELPRAESVTHEI